MVEQAKKKSALPEVYELYLKNIKAINNWDLVDLSAPHIIGNYLLQHSPSFGEITEESDPRKILYKLVESSSLWERRISILSTWPMIRASYFTDTLNISRRLLGDKEDLIHKAVGWMLRELGKRDQLLLENFLKEHYSQIPRTCLRYAIEKFAEGKRKGVLRG